MTAFLRLLFPQRTPVWRVKFALSLLVPALFLAVRPFGLNALQAAVAAVLMAVVTWWSTGAVKKIPASLFLLGSFLLLRAAPARTVFVFPLSENFPLLLLTYLFSQAIANSGLVEKMFIPLLRRFVHTPFQMMAAAAATFLATMYLVPQPLARLILVAMLFRRFLEETDAPEDCRGALMLSCFLLYGALNMVSRDADIILNNAAIAFAGIRMTDGAWIARMAVPMLGYLALIFALFLAVFRRELKGVRFRLENGAQKQPLTRREALSLALVAATVLCWVTQPLHHVSSLMVTAAAILLFFLLGILRPRDLKAIDLTTMVFLTAAFCIGGVLKQSGTADVLFGGVNRLLPAAPNLLYLLAILFVAMLMHMMLGSNTTTLSVVIPGLVTLCGGALPKDIVMLLSVIGVSFHSILPFHSVAIMIGVGNGYFPARYVPRFGIPSTLLVYLGAVLFFIPWWRLMGYL